MPLKTIAQSRDTRKVQPANTDHEGVAVVMP